MLHTSLHDWFFIGFTLHHWFFIGFTLHPLAWYALELPIGYFYPLETHIGSQWIGTIIFGTMVVAKRREFHIGSDIRWLVGYWLKLILNLVHEVDYNAPINTRACSICKLVS